MRDDVGIVPYDFMMILVGCRGGRLRPPDRFIVVSMVMRDDVGIVPYDFMMILVGCRGGRLRPPD
ncbi:hypothetical protein ING2D1G_0272 [Peptoniphilus sp. ING2-D1G]|nr:hypothetical protein ING2D1G_0272 [Peptoniphilus sp. ING2-D1G]